MVRFREQELQQIPGSSADQLQPMIARLSQYRAFSRLTNCKMVGLNNSSSSQFGHWRCSNEICWPQDGQ